jgi:hypothetical protein
MLANFDPKKQIAIIWSVKDVLGVRPDLTDEQCMQVLKRVQSAHDPDVGITWNTLSITANDLFPVEEK